jgi:hypothetical protein
VTLPTVMPTSGTPEPVTRDLAALHAENDELRRRIAALEEAMGRAPLAG